MAAELSLVDINDGSLDVGTDEDREKDVVMYRKNKVNIILSDDDDSADEGEKNRPDSTVELNLLNAKSPIDDKDYDESKSDKKAWNSKKILSILDSDSEDERIFDSSSNETRDDKLTGILTEAEKEDEIVSTKSSNSVFNRISTLVDTDSEEDDPRADKYEALSNRNETKSNGIKKDEKTVKKRTGSVRAAKEEAMREIHSETQRMFRESEVRLPYHKPKRRTLQEFLNRRKNLPILPTTLNTANKVKMSVELVGKVLEEKEKEAELFYKSSSDSDDEKSVQGLSVTADNPMKQTIEKDIFDENSSGVVGKNPECSETRKDIIETGNEGLGSVSRRLSFSETRIDEIGCPDPSQIQDRHQTNEELDQDSTRSNLPFKSHGSKCEDPVDMNPEPIDADSESFSRACEIREKKDCLLETPKAQEKATNEYETEDFELKMSEDPCETMGSKEIVDNASKTLESELNFPMENKEDDETKSDKGISQISNGSSLSGDDLEIGKKPVGHVYGLPLPDFANDTDTTLSKRAGILPDIMSLTPRLQGSSDTVIELSHRSVGVDELMKRFLKHSVIKNAPETSKDVTIMRTEHTEDGVKVVSEILPYKFSTNEKNSDPELSKPGAKLIRLKEELRYRMAARRTEEWKQKEKEAKSSDDEATSADEFSDCGMEDEGDVEDEEEEEEEEEEDDVSIKERKTVRQNPFVDAEAEEEDDGDFVEEESAEEADCDDDSDKELDESEYEARGKNKPGELKRIAKAFDDEESSDDSGVEGTGETNEADDRSIRRKRTDIDMFATEKNSDDDWLSGTEDDLPVYQRRVNSDSQVCVTPLTTNNSLSIVSPIIQLTALNRRSASTSGDLSCGQIQSQLTASFSIDKTPMIDEGASHRTCDPEKLEKLQKKLFDDVKDVPTDSELIGICSGRFEEGDLDGLVQVPRKSNVSDDELLGLCSGTFESQYASTREPETQSTQIKTKSQFLSIEKSSTNQSREGEIIASTLKFVFSSDEEEEEDEEKKKKKTETKRTKKKVGKLKLSDDEEEEEVEEDEGSSNFEDKLSDDEKFVDYDSEENEILVPKKDLRKAAARFLDEEAELSESDWGSADEDERDLDKLEVEEGDLEDIDQDQVRKQLEKMHHRQVLDADQREIRLLQEILLEDGDMHSDGTGRERKFRWKNIDKVGEDGGDLQLPNGDGEIADAGDQTELEISEFEWRKQRLEREQFLKENEKKKETAEDIEEEIVDSELFRLGMRAMKKIKVNKIQNKEASVTTEKLKAPPVARHTVADLFGSPVSGKKTFTMQNAIHRGSFLARGEESLARLAVITRQNSDQAIIRTKNSRNFVFAQISPAVENADVNDEKIDEQRDNSTADKRIQPRKRKPAFDATPVASKKSKKDYSQGNNRSKLFN